MIKRFFIAAIVTFSAIGARLAKYSRAFAFFFSRLAYGSMSSLGRCS